MDLIEYLFLKLGDLNSTLGYTSGSAGDFQIVLVDTLDDYGVTSESEVTDTKKFRLIGLYRMWEKILTDVTDSININVDGSSYNSDQLYQHCLDQFTNALYGAGKYLPDYSVGVQNYKTHTHYYGDCHENEF